MKLSRGYAILPILAAVVLVSLGGSYYYKTRMEQPLSVREGYESAAEEIRMLNSALLQYYKSNLSWPGSLNQLVAGGFFTGDPARCGGAGALSSPACTMYFGAASADGKTYSITVNLLQQSVAQAVSNQVAGGSVSGTTVTSTIGAPHLSEMYADYLQRKENPDKPERTTMETSIDVNDNSLLNIDDFTADNAVIDTLNSTTTNITTLETNRINLGSTSLTHSGSTMELNAGRVQINGELGLSGNVIGNNVNVSGINQLTANTVNATTGTIGTLSGNSLTYQTGAIQNLSGNSLTYNSGNIGSLSGNSLTYNSGNIGTLTGNSLNYGTGTIGALTGNTLTYNTGSIANLSGNSLNYGTGVFNNLTATNGTINYLTGQTVSYNTGTFGNLSATNLGATNGNITNLTAGGINANSVTTNTLQANSANIGSGQVQNANGSTVTVAGTSTFNSMNSNSVTATTTNAGSVTAGSGSVSGGMSVGDISVQNLNVTNRLTTSNINSTSSDLGVANASSFDITGALTASGVNVTTANIGNANIGSLTGSTANFSSVTANQFNGGAFSASNDFITPQSSVNTNYNRIRALQGKLDNCMYVTGYCLPKAPALSGSCVGCFQSKASTSFSATITVSISSCKQGCSYSWSLNGVTGSCSAGTVAAGGTASVSCTVSAEVANAKTLTGSVVLTSKNTAKPSLTNSSSYTINWSNTAPEYDPLDDLVAGCYVDTKGYDDFQSGGCYGDGWRIQQQEGQITFSVGNKFAGDYTYIDFPATVSWSGCTNQGNWCSVSRSCSGSGMSLNCPAVGTKTVSVTVTYQGRTRSFTITGNDMTRMENGAPEP
jgi:hypothetical protein